MIIATRGLVIRKIKYGDSSQIIHVFSEKLGLQSCMIKGLGKSKRGNSFDSLINSGGLLEFDLYYREDQKIKYIREIHPAEFYSDLGENILKNSVLVFSMEVLQNILTPEENQPLLFSFCQDFLRQLDRAPVSRIANFPLYFLIHSCKFLGYQLGGKYCSETPYLDLTEGSFTNHENDFGFQSDPNSISLMSLINRASNIEAIETIKMDRQMRQIILNQFLFFYENHLPGFKPLKSVPILSQILE